MLLAAWPVAGWGTHLLRPRDFPARASADAVLATLRGTAVQPPQPGEEAKKPIKPSKKIKLPKFL